MILGEIDWRIGIVKLVEFKSLGWRKVICCGGRYWLNWCVGWFKEWEWLVIRKVFNWLLYDKYKGEIMRVLGGFSV